MAKKSKGKCLFCKQEIDKLIFSVERDNDIVETIYECPKCGKKQIYQEGFGNEELAINILTGKI